MKFTNDSMYENLILMKSLKEKGKLGYAIARNIRKMEEEAKDFINVRDKIIKKYGEQKENGSFLVPEDKVEALNKEIDEYCSIEHNVDIFQIDEDTFCSGDLTSDQMYTLQWMVEDVSVKLED